MGQTSTEQRASERLAEAIDTLKTLLKTRPLLIPSNHVEISEWVQKYEQQEFIGEDKNGSEYWKDIKKSFNDATKPIKEAFKIIEAYYTEAKLGKPKEIQFTLEAK